MLQFEMKGIIIFYHLLVLTDSKLCSSPNGLVCCSGFVWDKIENRCLSTVLRPCKDGYYGLKCLLHCPFPYFGEGCVMKCNCIEEHCHHIRGCQSPQEIREDTTLSISYGYTPLDVELATSTRVYNKIEDRYQQFTNGRVIKGDTARIQSEESTTYLLRTAVVGLTFVVTILFVSYGCLTFLMKRNRGTQEDLIIING